MNAKETFDYNQASALQTIDEIKKAIRSQQIKNPNWANVGDMSNINDKLQNILDQINQTGEYAA